MRELTNAHPASAKHDRRLGPLHQSIGVKFVAWDVLSDFLSKENCRADKVIITKSIGDSSSEEKGKKFKVHRFFSK